MPLPILKLAMKAKGLPEVTLVARIVLGLAGVFVLIPLLSSLRNPSALSVSDYIGLIVFAAVGAWLLRVAIKGW